MKGIFRQNRKGNLHRFVIRIDLLVGIKRAPERIRRYFDRWRRDGGRRDDCCCHHVVGERIVANRCAGFRGFHFGRLPSVLDIRATCHRHANFLDDPAMNVGEVRDRDAFILVNVLLDWRRN